MTADARHAEELPEDYFTPTLADLKARQADLHARSVALNNAPLLTRAQREEQAKTKRDRWPNVRTSPPSLPEQNSHTSDGFFSFFFFFFFVDGWDCGF